jgi:hypothetical protein
VIVELIVKGLNAWQVVLRDNTSFIFRARYDAGLGPPEREETRGRIRERLGALLAEKQMSNVRFEIEDVESLAADPHSGKFRLVVREPANASACAAIGSPSAAQAPTPAPVPVPV